MVEMMDPGIVDWEDLARTVEAAQSGGVAWEYATGPLFAGWVVWPDHRNAAVDNRGEVYVHPTDISIWADVWTGEFASNGNPLLAPTGSMHFPDVEALHAWAFPPPVVVEVEPEPVYTEAVAQPVAADDGVYEPAPLAETPVDDGLYTEPPLPEIEPSSAAYFEPMPADVSEEPVEYYPPPPADTAMDVIAYIDPDGFEVGEDSGEYYPVISEV